MVASVVSRTRGVVAGRLLLSLVAGLCVVWGIWFLVEIPTTCQARITLGERELCVLLAETGDDIERGLGGRSELRLHDGMLFIFPEDGRYSFWMKDMRFAIDIVWIAADGKVVGIEQNVRPDSYPKTYKPSTPVRMVLEVPAGEAQQAWVGTHIVRIAVE